MSFGKSLFLHLERSVWPSVNGAFSSSIQTLIHSSLWLLAQVLIELAAVSFACRYTTALEIKATRYERTDLLHSSMHHSDENLLLSFTQEAGVSCEIMGSLYWNNCKMSYLFDSPRTKLTKGLTQCFQID